MKKILAAIDFSEAALVTAQHAVGLARRLGGNVTLLHMYHPWGDYFDPPGFREKMRPLLLEKLNEVIDKLDHEGITVETALEEGRAASGVVSFAQRWSFELIVVGSHGQGGAARTVLGSTAERIVRTSPVPVLVVPTEPPKTEHGATP